MPPLLDADRDYDVKVLILRANGKGFCSGTPSGTTPATTGFRRGRQRTGTPWKAQTDLFVKPTLNLWEFSKPTIARVHGYCLGGGTHYGLTTDIVIATDDAYFSYPPLQGFGMPSGECSIEPWVFMNWRRASHLSVHRRGGRMPQRRSGTDWSTRSCPATSWRTGSIDRPAHRAGPADHPLMATKANIRSGPGR